MVSRFLERKDEWVALCEKLLHDGKPEPSPIDLRALAQHTSDRRRSSDIFDVVEKCLEPTPNAKLLAKAIATVRYLVINGAEHVVDRAWRLKDAVGALEKYNSATCGKYGFQRGGRDEGGDVRRRAAELASVLGDVDRIRSLRAEAATHAHRDGPDLRHGQGGSQIVIGAGHSLAEIPGYVAGDDAVALAAQAAAPSARHGFGAGDAPPPAPPALRDTNFRRAAAVDGDGRLYVASCKYRVAPRPDAAALAAFRPVWKSTSGMDTSSKTSNLSISVKSKSIRLIFGRIDCSRRVLEAQPKSLHQNCRIRAH